MLSLEIDGQADGAVACEGRYLAGKGFLPLGIELGHETIVSATEGDVGQGARYLAGDDDVVARIHGHREAACVLSRAKQSSVDFVPRCVELGQIDIVAAGIDLTVQVARRGFNDVDIAEAIDGDAVSVVGGADGVDHLAERFVRVCAREVIELGQETAAGVAGTAPSGDVDGARFRG